MNNRERCIKSTTLAIFFDLQVPSIFCDSGHKGIVMRHLAEDSSNSK